ncbi:MAG: ribosome modulation factor [Halieaceae bacterium]|jgi:ribosome modulation factor|nr:ribosome modulation factor [Halieaceae bacterium]
MNRQKGRQKRDKCERAYHRGYHAGLSGRPQEACPHVAENPRYSWLCGWREGHSDNVNGFTGVSGVHREHQQI